MSSTRIFGIEIEAGTREELMGRLYALVGKGGAVATVNATMLEHARKSAPFHRTLSRMSLCIPDGVGVARAMRAMGAPSEALAGVELGLLLPTLRPELRIALYGACVGVAERAGAALLALAPKSKLVLVRDGYHHTPFEVGRELVDLRPDLVYICLGSPKQEEVALLLSQLLPHALTIGLGGSFDVWSGDKRRAPLLVRKMGLEWLFRMLSEPSRLAQLPTLVSFWWHAAWERAYAKYTKHRIKTGLTKK